MKFITRFSSTQQENEWAECDLCLYQLCPRGVNLRNHYFALAAGVLAAALLTACSGGGGTSSVLPTAGTAPAAGAIAPQTSFRQELAAGHIAPSCDAAAPGEARCFAYVVTEIGRVALGYRPSSSTTPAGYGPADLQAAYALNTTGGAGRTIAIVDAYNAATLESDLGVYRSTYGLPPCTTANGCFRKVNQTGGTTLPKNNASWGQETSLDVDMVSANCPNCKILVVEANSASVSNLSAAVNTAASLGAVAISNSYGGSESSTETSFAPAYNHAGVAITASNGDSGYGAQVPAAFNTLTAVGGTTLSRASNTRGWTETVWSGSGSGCSAYISKPSWQQDPNCTNRMIGDVAYIGDPNTGVAVYDSTAYRGSVGWLVFGGTSVGSPAIAAIYGLSGTTVSDASYTYAHTSSLNDVTTGSNGTCPFAYYCNGEIGYDGPTGNGTPNGTAGF
ncbi:MAG: peptidase S8 [Candidatus Velthaea sp.]